MIKVFIVFLFVLLGFALSTPPSDESNRAPRVQRTKCAGEREAGLDLRGTHRHHRQGPASNALWSQDLFDERTFVARLLPLEQQREVLDFVEQLAKSTVSGKSTRGIWEEVQEISARLPDEAWHDVPSDGSEQHDHYLYGAPKKNS